MESRMRAWKSLSFGVVLVALAFVDPPRASAYG
jgi:hypothetical protein